MEKLNIFTQSERDALLDGSLSNTNMIREASEIAIRKSYYEIEHDYMVEQRRVLKEQLKGLEAQEKEMKKKLLEEHLAIMKKYGNKAAVLGHMIENTREEAIRLMIILSDNPVAREKRIEESKVENTKSKGKEIAS